MVKDSTLLEAATQTSSIWLSRGDPFRREGESVSNMVRITLAEAPGEPASRHSRGHVQNRE